MLIDRESLTSFQFAREGGPTGIKESKVTPLTGKLRNAPLKVRIDRSDEFLLWILGGTSWKSTPHLSLIVSF